MLDRLQTHRGLQRLCAAAILLIVVFADVPGTAKYSSVIQNSGHAPAFGALALLLLNLLPAHSNGLLRRLGYAFALTVGLGIATELAQAVLHRDAEVEDVIHDAVGALGALGFYAYSRARRHRTERCLSPLLGLAVGIACTAMAIAPLVWCVMAYQHRGTLFPVLAQFRSPLDLYFVSSTDPKAAITQDTLYARLENSAWPGIELSEPAPNWSNYRELRVDVSNPGKTALPLAIRVNDRQHNFAFDDRFNRSFIVAPGSRLTLRYSLDDIANAPRSRHMDMHNIATVIIFRNGAVAGQSLLLHRIWLQ